MNKYSWIVLLLLFAVFFGCKEDDDKETPSSLVSLLWGAGSRPIASPDGERILFIQEGVDGGLYLLEGDNPARKLNESGPALRADYVWSHDGTRICFSGPGEPGEPAAGIYISTNPELTEFARIWDRGSDPMFTLEDEEILCAGPEDGENDGIWKIGLTTLEHLRIIPKGVQPALSPDGHKIAYSYSTGGSDGRTLVVFDRQSLQSDTVGAGAVEYTWLEDNSTIIYERVQSDSGGIGWSRIFRASLEEMLPGTLLIENATNPVSIHASMQFLYTAFSGDIARGIYLSDSEGHTVQIFDSGYTPYAVSENRILAASPAGIFEIHR
jgi:Tol biopolymer transport system component